MVFRSDRALLFFAEWLEGIAVKVLVACKDDNTLSVSAEYYNILPLIYNELGPDGLQEFYERLLRIGYDTKFYATITDHKTIEVAYCHPVSPTGYDIEDIASKISSAVIVMAMMVKWFHKVLLEAREGKSLSWLDLEALVETEG